MLATGLAYLLLFQGTLRTLARDWWSDAEAGHALLLVPLACYLMLRRGRHPAAVPAPGAGLAILNGAVLLQLTGLLAAEVFASRAAALLALVGATVYFAGWRQLSHWWLPGTLLVLSIPLPSIVVGSLSLPLQFRASELGALMLRARFIPVQLTGNVIMLPGQSLFVSEACSGLRSLTALVSLGVVVGGLALRHPASRLLLVLVALPIAVLVNGMRIFVTGFLVHHVNPAAGQGFLHTTEGWLMFLAALGALAMIAVALRAVERRLGGRSHA